MALCLLAVLPATNLWVVEALDRQHHGKRDGASPLTTHLSALNDPGKLREDLSGQEPKSSSEQGKPSDTTQRAREFGTVQSTVVAIAPIASPLTASPSFGFVSEPTVALLSNAVLFSAALAFLLSAVLAAGRPSSRPGSAGPAQATTAGAVQAEQREVSCDAHRLAGQLRCDIGEMTHAMRSPIAVITAYAERLKNVIPANDARAQRAIEAVGVSGSQLNELLDNAWHRGHELASLFLAERQPVDLATILRDATAEEDETLQAEHVAMGTAEASSVWAPPGALEKVVDELLDTILCNRPHAPVIATVETANGLARLHLAFEGAPAATASSTETTSSLEGMPLLMSANRTVAMLGGNLTATADENGVSSITMVLPSSDI